MKRFTQTNRVWLMILGILAVLLTVYYLFPTGQTALPYILNLRIKKLWAYVFVAVIASFSTFSFQAVIGNRFLTPSVLGLESLYVLMQSVYLFFFWKWSEGTTPHSIPEFFLVIALQCGFFACLQPAIKSLLQRGIGFILLVCMTLGTFFRSFSTFIQVMMDPNEYDKLQSRLFASLQNINQDLLWIVFPILLWICVILYRKGRILDVFYLGKDQAQLLGVNVEKEQRQVLWLVVLLTSLSTALIGPLTFFGFILANVTYLIVRDFRHRSLFLIGSLLGFVVILLSQILVERVFGYHVTLQVIVELFGGLFFFYLLYKERRKS
ncbi:iron chelate uptake ABC transporter family permease subunit [Streptococcus sp. DD13]|uniref:iron chelate uptake ABC transporter family permease subunit n=1 Tax=Streptococcus sp. DD13 TaxID=1777881 RepID=UPI00079B84BA|nr:iron chelate uptake ABC transporter family permease subunit [Streptococcus sp. DD13]KXT77356.1 hypothetical protein STRDD13_01527 [Streptococcus sp. DD13]